MVEGVADLLSHVDAICVHVKADHKIRQQLIGFVASVAPTQIHVVRVEEEEEIRAA